MLCNSLLLSLQVLDFFFSEKKYLFSILFFRMLGIYCLHIGVISFSVYVRFRSSIDGEF